MSPFAEKEASTIDGARPWDSITAPPSLENAAAERLPHECPPACASAVLSCALIVAPSPKKKPARACDAKLLRAVMVDPSVPLDAALSPLLPKK